MSSISNDTLMRAGKRRPRVAALVLLLLAAVYAAVALPWVQHAFAPRAEERENALANAEAVAETVEDILADRGAHDLQSYADLRKALFTGEDGLAYVRVWDEKAQLACEMARDLPQPRAGNGGRLPDLGFAHAAAAVAPRVTDARWVQTVTDLQEMMRMQAVITEKLDAGLLTDDAKVVGKAELREYAQTALAMAQSVSDDGVALDDVIDNMRVVQAYLRDKQGKGLSEATDASMAVGDGLSAALGEFRARADATPMLPGALAAVEPGAHWPLLRARRVLIPIFVPTDENDLAVKLAGYVESGFYDRDPNAMRALAATPAGVLALIALALLATGGTRRRKAEMPLD